MDGGRYGFEEWRTLMSPEDLTVVQILKARLETMKVACAGVGEPCVELPISEIKTFKDDEGHWRAVIGMDQLIYFIDNLLRRS